MGEHACVYAYVKDTECLPQALLTLLFETGCLLNLEFADLPRLVRQNSPISTPQH